MRTLNDVKVRNSMGKMDNFIAAFQSHFGSDTWMVLCAENEHEACIAGKARSGRNDKYHFFCGINRYATDLYCKGEWTS